MSEGGGRMFLTNVYDLFKRHPCVIACFTATAIGVVGLRRYLAGGVCRSLVRMDGKTVLVTGANTGIGRETAYDMARRGARVIMACRDITKAERAAQDIRNKTGNENVEVRIIDLASLESVRRFCRQILQSEKRLDILVNNAGLMACPQLQSNDGYELQFAVNHLGHFLLTNLLIGLLVKSAPSRIITVSSLLHEKGKINFDDINLENNYNPWRAYQQSKLANVMFTKELRRRMQASGTHGVSTFTLHPGIVLTELGRYLKQSGQQSTFFNPFFYLVGKTPVQGAQTSIYCAVTEGLEQFSGKYFSDCAVKKCAPHAEDVDVARRLWELSARMVKLPTGHVTL